MSVAACMGFAVLFSVIGAVGATMILGVTEADHKENNLYAAVERLTGGTLIRFQKDAIPVSANTSGTVLFTPEGEAARTCTLSTDDVKYTMTCPASDVVETILG